MDKEWVKLAAAAAGGALLAVVGAHLLPCPFVPTLKKAPKQAAEVKNAFVLAVRLKIKPGTLEQFKALWAPLAKHCNSSAEPHTLSYELCVGEEDPTELLIYERYVAKSDLTTTHWSSEPFKAFGKALTEAGIVESKTRMTYYESNVGHMFRTGGKCPF